MGLRNCNYFQNLNDEKKEPFASLKTDHEKNDFLNYDGNAQGLRVLTKLQILNDPFGLNLTYATLSASLKYPNFEKINKEEFDYFEAEKEYNKILNNFFINKITSFVNII